MRVVLDTNVLASGIIGYQNQRSSPGQLLRAWRRRRFELVLSEHILSELERTLQSPYFQRRLSPLQVARVLALLRRRATLISITVVTQGIATHPEDDPVVATAVSADADFLVTGDRELEKLGTVAGTTLLNPRNFLEVISRRAGE